MNIEKNLKKIEILVCPKTKLKFSLSTLTESEEGLEGTGKLLSHKESFVRTLGGVNDVLVREDHKVLYPVVEGIPIIMIPEMLAKSENLPKCDLSDPKYSEAYSEMTHYNKAALLEEKNIRKSTSFELLSPVLNISNKERKFFPKPMGVWIDAVYDCAAQWDVYEHIAPLQGKRVLQLGGKGLHAIKFLFGGAEEGWLITPILGEARFGRALANAVGVGDRFHCVVSIAEELPFIPNYFDIIYSGGCLHHMVTDFALSECIRVLRGGGKFGAVDPWKTCLHTWGTKILGKRESGVYCKPLTMERVEPLFKLFNKAELLHHGALTRYFLLMLDKFKIPITLPVSWKITQLDDAFCSKIPGLLSKGSSVALLAIK